MFMNSDFICDYTSDNIEVFFFGGGGLSFLTSNMSF